MTGANEGNIVESGEPSLPSDHAEDYDEQTATGSPAISVPTYKRAEFSLNTTLEPHEVSPASLTKVVEEIVSVEGPLHQEEIARRLAFAFGKKKAGKRIIDVTFRALQACAHSANIDVSNREDFWALSLIHI